MNNEIFTVVTLKADDTIVQYEKTGESLTTVKRELDSNRELHNRDFSAYSVIEEK